MRGKFLFGAASAAILVGLGFAGNAAAQQSDPPGDNTTQARLTPGQEVAGTLYPAGDKDWFRLSVTPGQRYSFTLNGVTEGETTLDPLLNIYSSAGESITGNDDANGTLNSALNFTPSEAGEVFVEARGFSEEAAGPYTLNVTAGPVPPDDAGNDATTRAQVTPGRPITGSLESEGDVDWYRLRARTNQRYTITLNGGEGDGALGDPVLRVINGEGAEIAANDDGGESSLNSLLEFTPAANGDVFIEAGGFGGQAVGTYTLNVAAERAPTDSISGDSWTRGRLALGETAADSLEFAGDRDWRRIRLEGGQSYRFSLNSNAEAATPLSDPLIKIFNNDSIEQVMDDDGGDGFNAYVEFTAPETGNYFVEARGFTDDAIGGYTLRAQAGDIPADATTDAELSAEGDFRTAVLSPAGDRDWYRINLSEGQGLRVAVAGADAPPGPLGDPYVAIYNSEGTSLAENDDANGELNSWLEFSAPTAGAYYLEVRGFNAEDAQGAYSISLTAGEIGATADTAEFIAAGAPRQSTISAAGDVDWYGIELIEGRAYRINLDSADGALDPVVTLYNSEGAQIAADDDGGTNANAYLSYTPVVGGVHYVAASAYGNEGSGGYSLRITDTEVPGTLATDEFLDAAGDERVSRIDIPGDLDSYAVMLEAGVRYTIEVRGTGDNPLADPFVAVLDQSGNRVASDDDSGPGLDARVTFTAADTDQFFIQASGLGGGTGTYRVSIAR